MFRNADDISLAMTRDRPYAVIIEPNGDLADLIRQALVTMGFAVETAITHAGAARLAEGRCPQLLITCVPDAAERNAEAYLAECRDALGSLPTVLLLTEIYADTRLAPRDAVTLLKPFTRTELLLSIDIALEIEMRHDELTD